MEPRRLMASTVIVTSVADDANDADVAGPAVTLRQAINHANATGGGTIDFDPAVFGGGRRTITLNPAYGELSVARGADVSVDGSAVGGVTVSGGDAVRVFKTDARLALKSLTVAHGFVAYDPVYAVGGAGVDVGFYGSFAADRCAFENNVADLGAAVYSNLQRSYGGNGEGGVTVTNSTFTRNVARKEAVVVNTGNNGLTLDNVTMSGNDGGSWLVYNVSFWEPMVVKNSTIAGNSVKTTAIFTPTTASELTNNTITGDKAGVTYYRNRLRLNNNVFKTGGPSLVTADEPSVRGTIEGGHNVVPDGTDGLPDTVHADPVLGTLGDYGGLVPTLPLLPGSPAIDTGAVVSGVSSDARGVPRTLGTAPDAGAFESRGFTLTPGSGADQAAWTAAAFAAPLRVTVASAYGEPVSGGRVTFAAPADGASAAVASPTSTIDADGVAAASVTANATAGAYAVTAATAGTAGGASFGLTNVAVAFEPASLTYIGVGQTAGYRLSTGTAPVTVSYLTAAGTPVAGTPVDAGTYGLVLTLNGQARSADFAIAKAALTATAADATAVYGQPLPTLTATLDGLAAGDAVTAGATAAVGHGNAGTYAITPTLADPNGRLANYAFTLVPGRLTIRAAATSLTLASSTGGVSTTGQGVSFTAKVTSAGGTPGGGVQFFSDGVSLGTVAVANGSATLTTAALAAGSHAVTAAYVPADGNFTASTAAVTQTVNAPAPAGSLLLLLNANERGALTVSGGAKVTVNGSLVVDSANAAAVVVSGSGQVNAGEVDVVGGQLVTGGGRVTTDDAGRTGMGDPLAGLATPTTNGLVVRSTSALTVAGSTTVTLQPGVYVGGIHVAGAAKVTLAPGVYYLKGGGLSVAGSAGLTGSGVLIYNAPTAAGDTLSFGGAAVVKLSPMTSGAWAGLTVFQARNSTNDLFVGGSASLKVTGSIYAASATLNVGGSGFVSTGGANLILDDLVVAGSGVLVV